MDDIIKEFLVESYENLDQLDSDFVALEETPGDRDRLASVFRTIHTIKGTSGFLAFANLEKVAHVGESLLVPLRDGDLELDHQIADALLAMVDAIRQILGNIESDGVEGNSDYDDLISRLEQLNCQARQASAVDDRDRIKPNSVSAAAMQEPQHVDAAIEAEADLVSESLVDPDLHGGEMPELRPMTEGGP